MYGDLANQRNIKPLPTLRILSRLENGEENFSNYMESPKISPKKINNDILERLSKVIK